MAQEDVFKKLVSHCKEYGFVFPSSDIYDGLGAVYDYGQMGVELKNNIKKYWWDSMVLLHENIVGIDSAIFMHPTIWKVFILFMAMFVTAFSATLLGLGKSRGNATDVFSPMGEGETKSA